MENFFEFCEEAINFKLQFTVIKVVAVLQDSSSASQGLACLAELPLSLGSPGMRNFFHSI